MTENDEMEKYWKLVIAYSKYCGYSRLHYWILFKMDDSVGLIRKRQSKPAITMEKN